jgi:DNA-binding beta-propeller fold protein YncE
MAYDAAGRTLYVADQDNNRIRAINRHGRIRTVAGGGGGPRCNWVRSGTPALSACLLGPEAVALTPTGQLLIASTGNNEILELHHGRLRVLAGRRGKAGVVGLGGPAKHASPDGPNGLAFDRQGNLWITGSNTKTLLVITPDGMMRRPADSTDYPRGDGGVVADPNGGIYLMDTQRIYRYFGLGTPQKVAGFSGRRAVDGVRGILPTGLAVTAGGRIVFDTDNDDGWTSASTLFRITPTRDDAKLLWRASKKQKKRLSGSSRVAAAKR